MRYLNAKLVNFSEIIAMSQVENLDNQAEAWGGNGFATEWELRTVSRHSGSDSAFLKRVYHKSKNR